MTFTADFYDQAQKAIMDTLQAVRPSLLESFGKDEYTFKSDQTVVTLLDKSIEHKLREELTKFDSSIGFCGEEMGNEGNDKTFWLIDPIDGTESFIRGIDIPRNMLTLIDGDKPVMTIVYKFITDELYTARAGQGAFCNGNPIHVSNRPIKRAWIEIGMKVSDPEVMDKFVKLSEHIEGYTMIRDFPFVATGKIDGYVGYKSGGGDWDYAPRALLVQEAGGRVANIGSDTYDYRNHNFLAANPVIFDEVMNILNS